MTRANNGGWDFIRVGKIYQYKEDNFIAMVKILEDNSNEEFYEFRIRIFLSNYDIGKREFDVFHAKDPGGFWSDMLQFYEEPVYIMFPAETPWSQNYTDELGEEERNELLEKFEYKELKTN